MTLVIGSFKVANLFKGDVSLGSALFKDGTKKTRLVGAVVPPTIMSPDYGVPW